MIEYEEFTDSEITDLIDRLKQTLVARKNREALERDLDAVVDHHRQAGTIEAPTSGDEWAPGVMYKRGDTVTHDGAVWVSTCTPNVWEPGESGWHQQTADGVLEWVAPTGAHDVYRTGQVVRYRDRLYRAKLDNIAHSPDEYPAGWDQVEEPPPVEGVVEPETDDTDTPSADEGTDEDADTDQDELPEWQPGLAVTPGDTYRHAGATYQAVQPHTTQAGWEPDLVPALWKRVD